MQRILTGSYMHALMDTQLVDETGRLAALHRYQVLDTPPEAPFEKITRIVQSVLGVPISAVSLVDADRQWFKSQQGLDCQETHRDVSFCAHTIKTREPMVVEDALADPRFADNALVRGAPFIRSYAGVPLNTPDGYNLGSLCAIDTRPRTFAPDQIALLKNFADLVIAELELRLLADRDGLTGALTRRAFVSEAEKEIERSRRYGRPASLILFDLDHFKAINDTHGHAAGDEVLSAVGACCGRYKRPSDAFGRIGGEEFALVLPETDGAGALQTAERLRGLIAGLVPADDPHLKVTASFGIAQLSPSHRNPAAWIAAADAALYAAKRSGRNRCVETRDPMDGARREGAAGIHAAAPARTH